MLRTFWRSIAASALARSAERIVAAPESSWFENLFARICTGNLSALCFLGQLHKPVHQRRAREAKPKGLRQDEEDEHVQVLQEVRKEVWKEVQQDPWQWRCQQAQGLGQVVVLQEQEELEEEEQEEEAAARGEGQPEEGESKAKGCKDTSGRRKNKAERVRSEKYSCSLFLEQPL